MIDPACAGNLARPGPAGGRRSPLYRRFTDTRPAPARVNPMGQPPVTFQRRNPCVTHAW
jgi:hypothetical protein